MVQTINQYSVVGYFYGHKNNYLILGEHYYWYMDYPENLAVDLINRTTTDYLEYRDGVYYYKERRINDIEREPFIYPAYVMLMRGNYLGAVKRYVECILGLTRQYGIDLSLDESFLLNSDYYLKEVLDD